MRQVGYLQGPVDLVFQYKYVYIIVKLDSLENEIYLPCTGTAVVLQELTG